TSAPSVVTRPALSGVLLAGGASRRFGADKRVALLDGKPLFHHPLRALAAVCDEVVVVIAPDHSALSLPAEARGVRVIREALGAATILEAEWARVDPTGEWRIDIDAPDDLSRG